MIGLEKPGGGARPIAISETLYGFAGLCALHTYGRGIGARLAPLQVGVGTPGGTETVAHALASALAEDPETVVIWVDMANAVIYLQQHSPGCDVCRGAAVYTGSAADGAVDGRGRNAPAHCGGPRGHSSCHVTAWSVTGRPLGSAVVRDHASASAGAG